eukprot:587695_1
MEFDSSSDEGENREIDDDSYHSSDDEPIIKQQASKPVIPPLPSFPLFNCNPNKKIRTDSTEITESTSTLFTSNNRNNHNKNKKKQSPPQVITKKKNINLDHWKLMWSPLNTSKPPRGNSHQNTFIT